MKKHQLATLLWLVSSISGGGQTLVDVRTQTKNVDFSGAASTIPTKSGSALPTSCKLGEMFFNTSNAPGQSLYLCAPANSWTMLAGGGGSTVGTVLSATSGQFAYYPSNGSTVVGHTLVAGDIPALNYQSPLTFTGTGANTASSTGSTTPNDCAKWDSNGNVVDAGAPCGSGSGGGATFTNLAGGTNSSATMLIGSGASLAATGTGSITATSVPASGVTGLATSATTDATNASNISSGTLSAARLPVTVITTSNASGTGSKYATTTSPGGGNDCAKWDANGNVVDAGAPCSSGSTAVLQASSHIAEGDSITFGYETTGTCNNGATGCAYPSLLAYDERTTLINRGTSGYQACDVAARETINNDLNSLDSNSIYTLMIGANDANVKGAGSYESVFKQCHQSAIAWNAVANKYAANPINCLNTGTWATTAGWAINGDYSFTNGSTKTCPITTYGGPIYAWYYLGDNNTGAFTYAVDSGTPVALTTAPTPTISTQNFPTTSYGWGLIRVPVAAGSHSIKFTVTSATGTGTSQAVNIGAIGTPPAQSTYGGPKVFVGGVPRQVGDANSGATAAYNADALADVNLLAGDGLGVYFVNVRNYLCTNIISGFCYNALGTAQDMVANNSTNPVEGSEDLLHPNDLGHQEIKQAFEEAMQFTPYVAPYTGTGGKTLTSTGAGASGDCAKWDANGNVVDAGAPCGSGGSGSSAWASLTPGTNTSGAFILGAGASLATSGTGTIAATSVQASGISGIIPAANLPAPTTSTLGGVQSAAAVSHQWINSISAAGVPALSQPVASDISGLAASATTDTTNAANISSGTLADARLPSDQCTVTTYTVPFSDSALTSVSSATPTKTLFTLGSATTAICLIKISGATSFSGISNLTAATVRLQSNAATPMLYSPNQDIFGTVGPATNNFWLDSGLAEDRTGLGVVAAFTFTCSSGNCYSSSLTAGSVTISIGTRIIP